MINKIKLTGYIIFLLIGEKHVLFGQTDRSNTTGCDVSPPSYTLKKINQSINKVYSVYEDQFDNIPSLTAERAKKITQADLSEAVTQIQNDLNTIKWLKDKGVISSDLSNIDDNSLAALRRYSWKTNNFNESIRSGFIKQPVPSKYRGLKSLMDVSYTQGVPYSNDVYRFIKGEEYDIYMSKNVGDVVENTDFKNTTKNREFARTFAGLNPKQPAYLVLESPHGGLDISSISATPDQEEVIIQANSKFQTTKVDTEDYIIKDALGEDAVTQIKVIYVKQLPMDQPLLPVKIQVETHGIQGVTTKPKVSTLSPHALLRSRL